jgi:hypothetical protein
MDAIGPEDKVEVLLATIGESHGDGLRPVMEVIDGGAVADVDAAIGGTVMKYLLQVRAAEIGVFVVERLAQCVDRHGEPGLASVVHILQHIDRVADGAQFIDQTDALGNVPSGAEKIHHVAVSTDLRLALDHNGLPAPPA